jgi:hypothetical protein
MKLTAQNRSPYKAVILLGPHENGRREVRHPLSQQLESLGLKSGKDFVIWDSGEDKINQDELKTKLDGNID